jgi:hypothetical protein
MLSDNTLREQVETGDEMCEEDEITTEEAGHRYVLAHRRFLASPSSDEDALREYKDAGDVLLATFVDTMQNTAQAAEAFESYRRALVRIAKNPEKSPVAKAVGRT